MFDFLKKKKEEANGEENKDAENPENSDSDNPDDSSGSDAISAPQDTNLAKIGIEIEKLKASSESFQEIRKAFNERFERTGEQIGELRAMILDRDRNFQELELKATKAADLVESVKPEKISTDVQRQDIKIEALKANIEGNEAMMNRIMEELKDIKRKIEFFRGVEEIIKLSEEVKSELIEIKKVEAAINIKTDKVEVIYSEIRKKFQEIELFNDKINEMKVGMEQDAKDIDFIKSKITGLAEKTEVEALVTKVQRYVDMLKELEKKSSLTKDLESLKGLIEGLK